MENDHKTTSNKGLTSEFSLSTAPLPNADSKRSSVKNMKKYFFIPSVISALVLWTLGWDNDFVSIIRLFAFASAFWCAFGDPKNVVSKRTSMKIAVPMVIVMLVYNPIFPTEIDYFDFYAGINIITGIALVWCALQRAKLLATPKVNVVPASETDPRPQKQIEALHQMSEVLIENSLDEDSKKICNILRINNSDEVRKYIKNVKMIYLMSLDQSFDRMVASIRANAPVELLDEDCRKIYEVLTEKGQTGSVYQKGDGCEKSPLVIRAPNVKTGTRAEYAWIS